jgi:hypothetical protein
MFHESIPLATLLTGKFNANFLLGLRVRHGTLSDLNQIRFKVAI